MPYNRRTRVGFTSARSSDNAEIMTYKITEILDLDRYPLHAPESDAYKALIGDASAKWRDQGACRFEGLIRPEIAAKAAAELEPATRSIAFRHRNTHNVYFIDDADGLPDDIAALSRQTASWTLTGDQMADTIIRQIYEWQPLCDFLRDVLGKPALYRMADPMAGLNVMTYDRGDQLDWHFDRAEFAVTVLLQAADSGGEFQYRKDLRSDADPNYDGIRQVLFGGDPAVKSVTGTPGTMSLFAGHGSMHRVAPVTGNRPRRMAVLSFMEEPGYLYSAEDRVRFYGRPSPDAPPVRESA